MPIQNIETKEYECGHCGYRWINRINGKDGQVPNCCAKCKRTNWNDPTERITPYEVGLRRRIKEFNNLYDFEYHYADKRSCLICWPIDLSQKFLEIRPRPTIKELKKVLYPFGYDIRISWSRYKVPDPDRPGFLKPVQTYILDPDRPGERIFNKNNEYAKLKLKEMELRQQYMIEIMESRGVDYDPELRLKIQREKRIQKHNEFYKSIRNEPLPNFVGTRST